MKLIILLVTFLLLAIFFGFGLYQYKNPKADNQTTNQNIADQLLEIERYDSRVNEQALRNRYNLDNNYDKLAQSISLLNKSISDIQNIYIKDSEATDNLLHKKFKNLSNQLEIKKDLIENFKSHNSIFKNSQLYAPIVGKELIAIAEQENLQDAVKNYREIIIELLEFSLHGSSTNAMKLNLILPKLLESEKQMPEFAQSASIEFINHVNTVIKEKSETDNYLNKALNSKSQKQISELSKAWKEQLVKNINADEKYNIYILWYILFLLAYIVMMTWLLRKKYSASSI